VPFEVPQGWELVQMSEIFILNPKNIVPDDTDAGFIPMAFVEEGFSGLHTFEHRSWGQIKKGFSHFRNGDIGIAKISPCFENLKSCIFSSLPNGIGAGTTELVVLRSIGVYAPFYLYLCKSSWYIAQGTKYFKGVVGQQRVNKEIFTDLIVPLPPYQEQIRIANEIERWFKLIVELENSSANLHTAIKQTKSKILDLAIHGCLVPQDPNDEPAIELLKRINPDFTPCDNAQYGKLPKGWCYATVNDCCSIIGGVSYNKEDICNTGIRILRGGNVQDGQVVLFQDDLYISEEYRSNMNQIQVGDIVVVASTGSQTLIGKTGYVEMDCPDTQIGAFLRIIRAQDAAICPYLRLVFQTEIYKNYIRQLAKGSNINNVKRNHLQGFVFPLPPLYEQYRIVAQVDKLFKLIGDIESSLQA
jgi:type I restriction enzyme S subunit